jgi:hypothetical protein
MGPQIGAGSRIPIPLDQLQQYNPNRADQIEGIWQPFYHKVTYLAAGQASLQFFNVAFSGDYTVTNMLAAANFPAPTAFFCKALMLNFIPGNSVTTSAAAPAAAQLANWADAVAVANGGYVEFVIGGKVYLRDSPSGRFAPNYSVSGAIAIGATLTAPAQSVVDYARAVSRYYEITPFLIPQTQNFSVTLYTPTVIPVTVNGTIIATMDGFYYRQSQ